MALHHNIGNQALTGLVEAAQEKGLPKSEAVRPIVQDVLRSPGQPLDPVNRKFMESYFDHDLSQVRVHTDFQAAESARAVSARAYTVGQDVVFGAGQYAPETMAGKKLLAHELVHTLQQQDSGQLSLQRAPLQEELDKELEEWAEKKEPSPSLNPEDPDYAFTLHEYAYKLTRKEGEAELIQKPGKKKDIKAWRQKFKKAHLLALMILKADKNIRQKEDRAHLIALDLQAAGFFAQAVEIAGLFEAKEKTISVYETILERADKVPADPLKIITQFYIDDGRSLAAHPLMVKLKDKTGEFSRKLGRRKLKAVLDVIIDEYKTEETLIDDLSEILIFYPQFRTMFSEWMWKKDKEFLFRVLESEYFVEPEPYYEPVTFRDITGKEKELTMGKDMPWVYTYKQKYYVDYLVDLGIKAGVKIPRPKSMKFAHLKQWLDTHTEHIGEALAKLYPENPEKITEVYEHITDIFFHHVDRGDVKPNLSGKLTRLGPSAPRKMRLKADCDVLATYATRLLKSSGFTPVGYLLIVPAVGVGHGVALLQKDGVYYVVNNKEVIKIDARDKVAAIRALRDEALLVYDGLVSYRVYYADAEATGAMPEPLARQDESTRREDLESE